MPTQEAQPTLQTPDTRAAHGPAWELVHFDVLCARCGHDLRGLDQSQCPACGLAFTWADAVPLEQLTCTECGYHLYGLHQPRCPECGQAFSWEEALDAFRRRKSHLFEHRWRDRPVRSFLRSWRAALRPDKLWHQASIHDRPPARPLLAMAAVALVVAALTTIIAPCVLIALNWRINAWWWGPTRPGAFWDRLLDFGPVILTSRATRFRIAAGLTWALGGLAALMIFRQSMRRYKIRNAHVIRVWAYAVLAAAPTCVLLVWSGVALTVMASWSRRINGRSFVVFLTAGIIALLWAHACWSIYHGYRHYLKMDHAAAVAISAQIIAALLAMTVVSQLALA